MFLHLVESLPRRVEAVIAAMFQHLVESLPRRVQAVIAAVIAAITVSYCSIDATCYGSGWGQGSG
jgi:hypothetical protein